MAFNDLFKVYPNRNAELRTVVNQMYEFGKTIAAEPSSAHSNGLDEHAVTRQRSYVSYANSLVEKIHAKPLPDLPATHPTDLPINMADAYKTFTVGVGGEQVPINESTQLLAEQWMICAVELAKSQSAALAGSLAEYDYTRAVNNLAVLAKLLEEFASRPFLDLPETADPGSIFQVRSTNNTGR